MSRRRECLRKWTELSAWTLGVALISLYGATRAWSESSRERGLAVLSAAGDSGSPVAHVRPLQPDQTGWSARRVIAYAESALSAGAPEGVLRIPSVRLEVPIYAGTTEINLNRGAARIEGTSGLTQGGNIGLAGHRDGFFRKLKDLRIDHEIDLEVDGRVKHYRVVEIRVVPALERGVLSTTQVPTVTLVTCYPFYFVGSAPERYIVRAERADE